MSSRPRIKACLIAVVTLIAVVVTAFPASGAFPGQGKRVLFARVKQAPARGSAALDLFTMKPTGADQERLIKSRKLGEYGGHWSPNSSSAVFTAINPSDGAHVYTSHADGTHRRQLTSTGANYSPNWSKNGSQIVWTRFTGLMRAGPDGLPMPRRGFNVALMVMDADGTHKRPIYDGYGIAPGWHPRRATIAFSREDGDSVDVWTVKPDGQALTQLTDYGMGTTALFGDWAPDGDLFTFAWTAGGAYTLWVAPTSDPSATVLIADAVEPAFAPVFTANGKRVIFALEDGDIELYSVKIDGTGEQQLTDNGTDDILTLVPLV